MKSEASDQNRAADAASRPDMGVAATGAVPSTIFVLRFSSAGDIVLTAPAVAAIASHWPRARVVYVTKAIFAELAASIPHVSEVLALAPGQSVFSLRRAMADHGPCAVLDLHGKLRSRVVRGVAPRRWRSVWTKRSFWQTFTVRFLRRPYKAVMPIAARYHRAAEALAGVPLLERPMRYEPSASHVASARAILLERGVPSDSRLVGISPGAMWETKRWPVERFADLAERVVAEGYRVVLTGSPAETVLTRRVAESVAGCTDLAGALSLGSLGGLVSLCSAFVANDSGPMHMARAMGVPTLTFFGSTDPGQFDFSGHALQFANLSCSPCSFHGLKSCPKRHLRCLGELTVEKAWADLQSLLRPDERVAYVGG